MMYQMQYSKVIEHMIYRVLACFNILQELQFPELDNLIIAIFKPTFFVAIFNDFVECIST
jgi:hypothetical protein